MIVGNNRVTKHYPEQGRWRISKVMWKLIILSVAFLLTIGKLDLVYGAVEQGETYYVKPILPANNQGDETSYYNLLMTANTAQTLQLEIVNDTETDKTFTVETVDSRTMSDGTIGYDNQHDKDSTSHNRFTNMVSKLEPVTVKARTKKIVAMVVKTPLEEFDGIVLGGVRVTERQVDRQIGGVANVFSYVVPVKIQETKKNISNQLVFQGIDVNQTKAESLVTINLENINPSIINNMSLQINITKENSSTLLYSKVLKSLQIAPTSIFSHTISIGDVPLEAGNYQVELKGTADGLKESWQEVFTIDKKQAKRTNDVFSLTNNTYSWQNLVIIVLLIAVGVSILFWIWRWKQSNTLSKKGDKRRKNEK
ncbi:DUF916 and DUF3324 domain-containing protein [uncultured Vagococcus sp.]|uniref:DUF916 and DUF3324 domain-containing protein n=1 Tax=uncultured Vagococcus sp. TaxID=189676 RepID=UPI0028D7FEA5|nr:DUF916 and DUF3324 domain-containing protein [uncultured Vagococcus sp.]